MDDQAIIDHTRRWIAEIVIGLNLCPFAERVFKADRIRYVVSGAHDSRALRTQLTEELRFLAGTPATQIETTLLIHPHVFADFLDYNDFLDIGERTIRKLGLEGVIQLASFHPHYQFADTEPDDLENYTNRSPYPMLHLLREESISAVAWDESALLEIPQRNIATLQQIGRDQLLEKLQSLVQSDS